MKIFQPIEFTSPFIPFFFLTNLDFCSGEMSKNVILIIILCFRRRLFYFLSWPMAIQIALPYPLTALFTWKLLSHKLNIMSTSNVYVSRHPTAPP